MVKDIDIYLLRQIFIISSGCIHSLGVGIVLSFPAVLNPSLLSPNNTDMRATVDQTSWLGASYGIAGVVGLFIMFPIMQIFDRKIVFNIVNVGIMSGWATFYFAQDITALFVAKILQGLGFGALFITCLIVSEYSHPTRRGYFTATEKFSVALGALLCHSLTLCCTWRQIAAVASIPILMSFAITLFWPESPSYLAMQGRFEECENSFLWINGTSLESWKELKELIAAQKDIQEKKVNDKNGSMKNKLLSVLLDKSFLKAFATVSIITLVINACGKFYFLAYVIQIIIEITGNKSIAVYCSIGADCLAIVGCISSCLVIRMFKRRTMLFIFGGFSVCLMYVVAFLNFLLPNHYVVKWIISFIILLNYFIVNISISPVCFTLFGELFPVEYRGIGTCVSGIVLTGFHAFTMKLTPILMESSGIESVYATYGSCMMICFVILYFILPETKDKTLQEIEDEIRGVNRSITEAKPMLLSG